MSQMSPVKAPRRGWRSWILATVVGMAVIAAVLSSRHVPARTERVSVGITNTSTDAGIFIADKKGFFREEGLVATLVPFNSAAQMIAPLGAGQLDVGGGTVAAGLYNAIARGINVKVVADKASIEPGHEYSTLVVRKDLADNGTYKRLKDLKGLKIATAAQGAGSESALNEALKKGGLAYGDVDVVYMGFPQELSALANRAIDAGVMNEPTLSQVLHRGLAVRASPDVIYPGQQTAVLLYADDFSTGRKAIAQKFMVAYLRALRFYNDALQDGRLAGPRGDEIAAILTEYTAIKDPAVYRDMTPFAADADGRLHLAALRNDFTFFASRGLIDASKVSVDQAIDTSFVDGAVRELGPYRKSTR